MITARCSIITSESECEGKFSILGSQIRSENAPVRKDLQGTTQPALMDRSDCWSTLCAICTHNAICTMIWIWIKSQHHYWLSRFFKNWFGKCCSVLKTVQSWVWSCVKMSNVNALVWAPAHKRSDGWCQAGKWRLTLILQSCISIMTSQPKADQNLREVGEGCCVTNHRNNKQRQWT